MAVANVAVFWKSNIQIFRYFLKKHPANGLLTLF